MTQARLQIRVDTRAPRVSRPTRTAETNTRAEETHEDDRPLALVWDRDLPESPRSVQALRRLGVEPRTGASAIRRLLPPERFVPLTAANYDDGAKVMWLDPDLARLFGFPVSRGERLSPTLERSVLSALAYRLPEPGEELEERRVTTLFADRYGGAGLGDNEGAGRAAFFPFLNLYAKGIGRTPLHHPAQDIDDRVHETGLLTVREAAIEAVWGQVGDNLFTHGAARSLAILELGGFVRWGESDVERACILLRSSLHARPAHILDGDHAPVRGSRGFFLSTARELGLIQSTREVELRVAIRKVIERHAETAAEQFRFRVLHGAISTSNMLLSGEQIDVATMRSQLRTAPIRAIENGGTFGDEHMERMDELRTVYGALLKQLDRATKGRMKGVDFRGEMAQQYQRHLELQFLKATGFKAGLAARLAASDPALARNYGTLLHSMCRLGFEVSNAPRSVFDVFGLLARAPERLTPDRSAIARTDVLELLEPDFEGAEAEEKSTLETKARKFVDELTALYPRVLTTAERWAGEFYDDVPAMRRSVALRAAFENRPLDRLTPENLNRTVDRAARQYDPFRCETRDDFWREIDDLVATSLRSIDGLFRQGRSRRIGEDTLEFQARTVAGVHYAIRAARGGARELRVTLPLDGDEATGYRLPGLSRHQASLSRGELTSVVYQFTTRGWREVEEEGAERRAPGRLDDDFSGLPCLAFSAPLERGSAGLVEGVFEVTGRPGSWLKDGHQNFRGYAFAVPDGRDLEALLERPPASSPES